MSSLLAAALSLIAFVYGTDIRAEKADLRLKTVVIDAGHGGKDAGTVSADRKTYEKTLTLKLSRKFAQKVMDAYPDMTVVLTRDNDVFVPLMDRAGMASKAGANLFISIHINAAARSKTPNGFSAYILGPSKKSSYDSYDVNMEALQRENSVIFLEEDYSTKYQGYDPDSPESEIFMQLMQNAFREQSLAFAECVSKGMDKGPFRKNWGVMQGNFCVLRQASMPAVLLEYGFMTNPEDLATLRSEASLDKIVDNLFSSFVEYKEAYDASVAIGDTAAQPGKAETAADPERGQAAKAAKAEETPSDSPVFYGIQVLASSKEMSPSDRFFKGKEMISVRSGKLYKYIVCPSDDLDSAKKKHAEIKSVFPESFVVKVEGGSVTMIK